MKPNMVINVAEKKVKVKNMTINLMAVSALEFADTIIDTWEHLWSADECNSTRRDLIQLHQALQEV